MDKNSGRKTNAKNEIIKNLNVLNVYSDLLSMYIEQEMIEEKTNEITAIPDVIDYFDEDRLLIIESGYEGAYKKEIEKSHSQVIRYEYYQTEKVEWYADVKEWSGLKSIGLVVKTSENKKKNINAV